MGIKAYKGFNKDMTCRGFQYEEGKDYETDSAKVCKKGFHACEYPLDVFRYYEPSKSVFHEVELDGDIDKDSNDSKVASTKIHIGARLDIAGLVKASVEFIKNKCVKENDATGDMSANSATGYGSANVSTGSKCTNESNGEAGISVCWGPDSKAKGEIGNYLVISEWEDGRLICAKMRKVDGKNIKANTFYVLKDGKFVEVK